MDLKGNICGRSYSLILIGLPEFDNNKIRRIDLATGIISTVAGNGASGLSGDGRAANLATLSEPVGIAVDNVLGEEDIVIKSMAENYRNVQGIAGASILGDGRVSLILDVAALIDMSSHNVAATAETQGVSSHE